ncbi:MAG TPA: hypothetical protein VNT60_09575 [Deinococcales bacterium]|nr:hypothetical protein [Deinococcales bacterium]
MRLAAVVLLVATLLPAARASAAGHHHPPRPEVVARYGETWALRVRHELGDGFLLLPPACRVVACPLVIVSHRRGGRAADALSPREHGTYHAFLLSIAAAGFPLLLSEDGGPNTWGNATALDNAAGLWREASGMFQHDGLTFSLGVSMGGLTATLLHLSGRVTLRGTVLIDARLNLAEALAAPDTTRAREIIAAYGLATPDQFALALAGHDPLDARVAFPQPPAPTLAFASPDDETVPMESNSGAFIRLARQHDARSSLHRTSGPHLGGSHFSSLVATAAVAFFRRLASPDWLAGGPARPPSGTR